MYDKEFENQIKDRLANAQIELPDYETHGYPGSQFGSMKAHHIVGNTLHLGGHVPNLVDGSLPKEFTGRLGDTVSLEDGVRAARLTAINCLAGIHLALGSLSRVKCIVRSLNFVVCTPDFYEANIVANGATDLFEEILGHERGVGGRGAIGVVSLAHNPCFENWLTVEFE